MPLWHEIFHVYCDASNEAIGSILVQNITSQLNSLIYCTSQLLNQDKRNNNTTK